MAEQETTETVEETAVSETEVENTEETEVKQEPDWKSESRKHERRAKQAARRAEELEAKLAQVDEANQTDQEKAIAKAREEAIAEARAEADQERRKDRLEVATSRLAARGVTVGEGEDARTVKFDDPEDALIYVERMIAKGDLDHDDIFDSDGKVQTETVAGALAQVLASKPGLAAADSSRPSGDAGAGRGEAAKNDMESMSMDDHFKSVRRTK